MRVNGKMKFFFILVTLFSITLAGNQNMDSFKAKRITRTHTISLNSVIENVMPLFEPYNEAKWLDGWHIIPVYPDDGSVSEGFVFVTDSKEHHHKAIWHITRYDKKENIIEYFRVEPDIKTVKIFIKCSTGNNKTTEAAVTYTITALSQAGNDFVDGFTDTNYKEWINEWQEKINYYFETGTALKD